MAAGAASEADIERGSNERSISTGSSSSSSANRVGGGMMSNPVQSRAAVRNDIADLDNMQVSDLFSSYYYCGVLIVFT